MKAPCYLASRGLKFFLMVPPKITQKDFKSPASTDFAIRAAARCSVSRHAPGKGWTIYSPNSSAQVAEPGNSRSGQLKKKPCKSSIYRAFLLEAEVGIEPAFTDLQSGA